MLITKASEYALLSLVLLSKSNKPLECEAISKELNISKSFLAKILGQLVKSDILHSFKGAHGGFQIARNTDDITLLSIIQSVEGKSPQVFECSSSEESCPEEKANECSLWPYVNTLQHKIDTFFEAITLQTIIDKK